jgi:hypothetical protein
MDTILVVNAGAIEGGQRRLTLGQPGSAAEPARRHIDQHQVHRPATEPVLLHSRFPARDRDLAAVHAPDPRALDLDLAAVEADPSPRSAPTVRPPRRVATVARPAGAVTSASIIVPSASIPAARQNRSKLARTSANASSTAPVAGEPAGVISLVMALLSLVESAPRAYRLKVGNADLFRNSTEPGTSPLLAAIGLIAIARMVPWPLN